MAGTNLQKAAGHVHEINLQREGDDVDVDEDVEHGVAQTAALLIQHDIARKMQKLNEGHLQVALHPTLLLFLLPLLLLLPAAATKIRKRIKRIRENSSTISHLFVSSSSSSSAGSSRGGWLGGLVGWPGGHGPLA